MFDLLDDRIKLRRWQRELGQIKYEMTWRAFLRAFVKANFNTAQRRDDLGRWTSEGGVRVTSSGDFMTGIPTIDEVSLTLRDTLVRVMETLKYLPTMSPQVYGIAVHVAFGISVKYQDLPGVGDIERSFSRDNSDPRYGLVGTVRTDVTLRNIQGDIIAIYDVKTGERRMSQSRADQLREYTGASPNTPVFELNVVRGIRRKSVDQAWRIALYLNP